MNASNTKNAFIALGQIKKGKYFKEKDFVVEHGKKGIQNHIKKCPFESRRNGKFLIYIFFNDNPIKFSGLYSFFHSAREK